MNNQVLYNEFLSDESIHDIEVLFGGSYEVKLDFDNSGLVENYPVIEFIFLSIAGGFVYDAFISSLKALIKKLKMRGKDKKFKVVIEKGDKLIYISGKEIYLHSNGERIYFETVDDLLEVLQK
jgi:hypothetical protein